MRATRITLPSIASLALLLAATAPANAHESPVSQIRVLSAAQLLRMETPLLGAGHAADHAAARAAERRGAVSRPVRRQVTSRLEAVVNSNPAVSGSWDVATPGAFPGLGINVVLLRTGKVLYWGGRRDVFSREDQAHIWDPRTGEVRKVLPPTRGDETIFCSGLSLMADGRVLVTGGQIPPLVTDSKGARLVMTFDPVTETWTRNADMKNGRYYPSQVMFPDGRSVSVNGTNQDGRAGTFNPDIELFSPAQLDAGAPPKVVASHDPTQQGDAQRPPLGGFYPHLFSMPSGKAFLAGPNRKDSWFFEVGPAPADAFRWWRVGTLGEATREYSTAVILPNPPGVPGVSSKVLLLGGTNGVGGGNVSLRSAQVFDESRVNFGAAWNGNDGATWQASQPLNIERGHHNTVLLPDGKLVTVGGGWGSRTSPDGSLYASDGDVHRNVELYDPQRPDLGWRLGAAQRERRAYHSTAALLPDATVLSAGDDGPGAGGGNVNDTFEIYRPPYLFTPSGAPAARPTITAAPTAASYGSSFAVGTSGAVSRAVLVAPSAVTHAVDVNQRHVELAFSARADGRGIDVAAPPTANVAPPGFYMLFVFDGAGVPSVARFVQIGADVSAGVQDLPALGAPGAVGGSVPGVVPGVVAGVVSPPTFKPIIKPSVKVVQVTFARTTVGIPSGRKSVVVLTVRRGLTRLAKVKVTVRWLGRRTTWIVRTDKKGVARITLTGRRGGLLEARVGSSRDRLKVSLKGPARR